MLSLPGKVILKEIDINNWKECANLTLNNDQLDFLPSNLYSIAESQFYPDTIIKAIYNQHDQMIGFIMYGIETITKKWRIFRIMIDRNHQGKGYGRAVMQHVIDKISKNGDNKEILVAYQANNSVAKKIYADLGFIELNIENKTAIAELKLK